MGSANPRRRLVVNADDFGRSASINKAVIEAHRKGILTSASLMVNGAAADEAVVLAKENLSLGVGLHLTLCDGMATLPHAKVPALVNEQGGFRDSAFASGWKYFFSNAARVQLEAEIAAQFEKFITTGLLLDHVNGHLHFHLHPVVLPLLIAEVKKYDNPAVRLTNDPILIDWSLGRGRWGYRLSHALIFRLLAAGAKRRFQQARIRSTDYVFGLLEDSRVTENYILKLLRVLPDGNSELYSHPSLDTFRHELDALVSECVKAAIEEGGIELIRYQDL